MINKVTTEKDLCNLFTKLGVVKGMDLFVHSSLKSLGFVVNGAIDVIDSLINIVDIELGTILMPSHSGQMTDPKSWKNPPIKKDLIETVRKNMKPFSSKLTPIRGRGVIPETFLRYNRLRRSKHPLNSVSALGRKANFYTREHDFNNPEGLQSPIGKMYQNNGHALLTGVSLKRCTAIHLAEYIAGVEYLYEDQPSVLLESKGIKSFKKIDRYPSSSENFDKMLPELLDRNIIKKINFNNSHHYLFKIKPVVDFAFEKLKKDPLYLLKPD